MAENQKCAHPACNCKAPKGNKYCSVYCHDSGKSIELTCHCGHPACNDEPQSSR